MRAFNRLLNLAGTGDAFGAMGALKGAARSVLYGLEDLITPQTAANVELRECRRGGRCFIFGTGVSVDEIEFAALANEATFGCGLLCVHEDFAQLRVKFYAEIQHLFGYIYCRPHQVFTAIDETCTDPETRIFVRALNRPYLRAKGFLADKRVHYVKPGATLDRVAAPSTDLAGRIDLFGGSVQFMVAAAIYMGFTEIYLCGCGYTYRPTLEFHFYDEQPVLERFHFPWTKPRFPLSLSEAERESAIAAFSRERGVEPYSRFRSGDAEVVRFIRHTEIPASYRRMNDFAISRGVTIRNIVPSGFDSPVFEKVAFTDLFPQSRSAAAGRYADRIVAAVA